MSIDKTWGRCFQQEHLAGRGNAVNQFFHTFLGLPEVWGWGPAANGAGTPAGQGQTGFVFAQTAEDEQRQTRTAGLVSRLGRGADPGARGFRPGGGRGRCSAPNFPQVQGSTESRPTNVSPHQRCRFARAHAPPAPCPICLAPPGLFFPARPGAVAASGRGGRHRGCLDLARGGANIRAPR